MGVMILASRQNGIYYVLGAIWLALAAFDASILIIHDAGSWGDWGSYWIFIAGMLWIGAKKRGWLD